MLGSLSIAARIYAGFAIVLALLATLAVFTFTSMQTVGDAFGGYRGTARQTVFVAEGVDQVYEARLAAMRYRLAPGPEPVADLDAAIAELEQVLSRADDLFAGEPDRIRQLEGLGRKAAEYQAAFAEMTALQDKRDGAVAELVALGSTIRKSITVIMESAYGAGELDAAYHAGLLQQEFLRGRVAATRFLLANAQADIDEAMKDFDSAATGMRTLEGKLANPALKADLRAAADELVRYRALLQSVNEIIATRNAVRTDKLDVIGPAVQAEFNEIVEAAIARQNTLGPQASDAIEGARTVSMTLGVGAVIAGLVLAFVIGRWIAGAVQAMAGAMGRMAQGDLDIVVTGDEHAHELGQMAKALKVFQTNGLEMRRLAAEQKAAADRDAAAAAERAALQQAVATVVDRAAAGDFAGRVETRYADEALNGFARQLNGLLETVGAGVGETATVMAALARGDLTAAMAGAFRGAFAELQANVNGAVERMRATVVDIQTVAADMSKSTGEISAGATDLAGRAENQAASLEEIAATMEEMATTVKTNADNAASATQLGAEATSRADKGGKVVADAVTAMSQIAEGSRKIADIVSVIDGFAFQTNLLALNAAVEAARAGEAGKGFAVVASEVRTLAQRSAEAARDIKALIDSSAASVKDGVRLVEETGEVLREIVEAIRKTSGAIAEIGQASREQSSGVDEISSAIASMDQITQQNSALAEESASAAKGLATQAARLTELTAFFTVAARAGARRDPSLAAFAADAAADRAAPKARARA